MYNPAKVVRENKCIFKSIYLFIHIFENKINHKTILNILKIEFIVMNL